MNALGTASIADSESNRKSQDKRFSQWHIAFGFGRASVGRVQSC